MSRKAFQVLFVAGIVASLMLAACQPQPTSPPQTEAPAEQPDTETEAEQPEVYKVGFFDHLTGDGAVYGQAQKQGTELAEDMINKAGGINGVPVEVIYEDDRMNPADAQTAVLKLIQTDKVPIVLGAASSTVSLSVCPKINELKVVQVTISTSPLIKDCGPYLFSVMASDTAQGPEWVKVAEYLGVKEAAVVYSNNDYGIGVKDSFCKAFEETGGTVLVEQPIEVGAKDFRTEVLKVKGVSPEVTFLVDHMAEGSIFVKQAKELGLDTRFVTDVAFVAPEFPQLAGEAAEGVMGLRAGSSQSPEFKAFRDAFLEKFEQEPTIWSDFAYDAMMMAGKAIEEGGYTSEGIREAMLELGQDYPGASGAKTWDEYGVTLGVYEWMIVKDGEWTIYEK